MFSPLNRVLARLPDAKRCGNSWKARCQSHEDRNPSLSVWVREDGSVGIQCKAGCEYDRVLAELGLSPQDLQPDDDRRREFNGRSIEATYRYVDDDGAERYQKVRYHPKDFRIRRRGVNGQWEWTDALAGQPILIYRQPEVNRASSGATIVVAGGEKDVESLRALGFVATCNIDGEGNWRPEHASRLPAGCRLIVMLDNDKAGEKFGRLVASSMYGKAASIKLISFPELPLHGDVSDFLAARGTEEQLSARIDAALEWSPEVEPWPEIDSLFNRDLPCFPTEALPIVLREWVESESEATQTPPDLAALLALAVISAAIARRVVVAPRAAWNDEPVNLFVAVLMEPGNRKSAVFLDAVRPLRILEKELIEEARPAVARERSERRQMERKLAKSEKLAAEKEGEESRLQAGDLAEQLALQSEPTLPRLLVDDATAEKLGMLLADQGGRIASLSPEGGVFDLMAGMYSKCGAVQFDVYLKSHAGDELVTDRVSRESIHVERPALTCGYAIQPAVIRGLAGKPAFRGRGLLARFLYSVPASWIGRRKIGAPPMPSGVRDAYERRVRDLASDKSEAVLRFTAEAVERFERWESEIERSLDDGGEMERMRDWGAKLAGATARIAATIHCVASGARGTVERQTIESAIQIACYLIPHAEAAHALMAAEESATNGDARYVLRWIKRRGLRDFSKRDAQQHGKRRFSKAVVCFENSENGVRPNHRESEPPLIALSPVNGACELAARLCEDDEFEWGEL